MMVKVFKFNNDDKIEFTQNELEKLLNEVYNDGYKNGRDSKGYTWTSPSWGRRNLNTTGQDLYNTTVTVCNDNVNHEITND